MSQNPLEHRLSLSSTTLLCTLLALLAAALFGPPLPGPLERLSGPEAAAAAQCRGADSSPRKLATKRARKLVICLVNKERRERGIRRLSRKDTVGAAARHHTKQMKRRGCFSHTCPGERDLSGRLHRSRYLPCNCSWSAGENIATGKGGGGSPRAVFKKWMASSTHRAHILRGSYEHVGVGFLHGSPWSGSKKHGTYTINFGYKR